MDSDELMLKKKTKSRLMKTDEKRKEKKRSGEDLIGHYSSDTVGTCLSKWVFFVLINDLRVPPISN